MPLTTRQKNALDPLIKEFGTADYKWIDPKQIVVAQWVRMKCMFGCGEYGHCAVCPPNVPEVDACERFFHEYTDAAILHFPGTVEKPEDRHAWTRGINKQLIQLERAVFLAGYERAFQLFMDSCTFCKECSGKRTTCVNPRMARPSPESMAVDVYTTVRRFGFEINVRTGYDQTMDRFAFLMVH